MRSVRFVIAFLLLVFAFIFQTELYQSQLFNFSAAFYKQSEFTVNDDERQHFIDELKEYSSKSNVGVFTVKVKTKNTYKNQVDIYYYNNSVKKSLKELDIEENTYQSLFNGISTIYFHKLDEMAELKEINSISFVGDDKDIDIFYHKIKEDFSITYPEFLDSTEKYAVTLVWSLLIVMIIIMNSIEVIRTKKEIVLRVFFGEGVSRNIFVSMLKDLLMYGIIYFLARITAFSFVSGEYVKHYVLALYCTGVLVSVLPYISYAFYDLKKVVANIRENVTLISVIYALKSIVFAVAMFSIITNLNFILNIGKTNEKAADMLSEYNYFSIMPVDGWDDDAEQQFWDLAYRETFIGANSPFVCVKIFEDNSDFILMNKPAGFMLKGMEDYSIKKDTDIVIFLPDNVNMDENLETSKELIDKFLVEKNENLNVQYLNYNNKAIISYVDINGIGDLENTLNPVVIYVNNDNMHFKGYELVSLAGRNILYDFDEKNMCTMVEESNELDKKYIPVVTNFKDFHEYRDNFVKKIIGMLSSFCVIVFLLNMIITVVISRMEYKNQAIGIALKKIAGYNIVERNHRLFLLSSGISFVIIAAYCVVSIFTGIFNMKICLKVGLVLEITELIILLSNIFIIETKNIAKTLKGDCL